MIDKYGIGIYGVIVVEAMFAGRLVLGHVSEAQHKLLVVEILPNAIECTIRDLTRKPDSYLAITRHCPSFARSVHDGRATVRAIKTQLQEESQ